MASKIVASAGAEDPSVFTFSGSDFTTGCTIGFKELAAAGGRIMSSLVAAGGLAGKGGIAGQGGGLAG